MIRRPTRLRRLHPGEPELAEIKSIDEGVDHSNRAVLADPVI